MIPLWRHTIIIIYFATTLNIDNNDCVMVDSITNNTTSPDNTLVVSKQINLPEDKKVTRRK